MMVDPVELTRRLVAVDTTNPPGREDAALAVLEPLLLKAGFAIERCRIGPERSNLIATYRGRRGGPALAFTGHVDTVPLGSADWRHDPFAGEEENGRLYGRGVSDMKSGVAAFIAAAVETARNGGPERDLVLVVTAGEERGCEGAEAMRRQGVRLPELRGWVVAEPTANRLALGHKGALFLTMTFTGRTAHSSMPEQGENAIYKAAEAALRVRDLDLRAAGHPVLGNPTMNVAQIVGGHAPNAVPDRAEFAMDVRSVPGMRHEEVLAKLRETADKAASVSVLCDVAPVWTEASDPFVAECRAVLSRHGTSEFSPRGMPFFTDASVLAAMAPAPVIILGPGEPTQAHQTDEWCSLADIRRAAQIYASLMRK